MKIQFIYKMWVAAVCIIGFGGLGTCIRSINDDKIIFTDQGNHTALQGLSPTGSAEVKFSTNDKPVKLDIEKKSLGGFRCQRHDLKVSSDVTRYLPNGMPMYRIQIANTCIDCSLVNIHLACGAWASETLVNPNLFRRVSEDDCVVNNGNALDSQDIVFFEYSNSFPYPMGVRSANPVCD